VSNIVPLDGSAKLPAYLQRRQALANINNEVVTAAAYPTMSIKGKQFTIKRDGLKTTLMNPNDPEETAQKIEVAILRVNMHNRVFYLKRFDEASSEGAVPDCFSLDGKAPAASAPNKQHTNCAACPHSVWGSRVKEDGTSDGKGRACSDQPRAAIAAVDKLDDAMLLRIPPASITNLKDAIKLAKQRNIPYNALVYRLGFDKDAASPKLTFKPVGLLDDPSYEKVETKLYDGELVRAIVGLDDVAPPAEPPAPPPAVDADELDAALAARAVTQKAKAKPAPAPAPKPAAPVVTEDELDAAAPAPAPAPAPRAAKPAPAPAAAPDDDLLSGLDTLLGTTDD
jgi:hypothetical protein